MDLKLVRITSADLDGDARCILALKNQPFCFLWYRGYVLMNREMEGVQKLTEAVKTMWKYDRADTDEVLAELDAAYNTVAQTAGKLAAGQLMDALGIAAERSRKARAEAAALEWVSQKYETMSDEEWDEIYAAGYSSDFVREGLWAAFSQLEKLHPDDPRYRHWITNSIEAAFVYGFQLAQKAANGKAAI